MASTIGAARRLRRHQTNVERVLWFRLRNRRFGGWKFGRQMETSGYFVLRFWNNDILQNIDGAREKILSTISQQPFEPPHPTPLPKGEREPA